MSQENSVYSVKIPNVVGYDPVDEEPENKRRRDTVKEAFRFAYTGYMNKCMGQGELKPQSGGCTCSKKCWLTELRPQLAWWQLGPDCHRQS